MKPPPWISAALFSTLATTSAYAQSSVTLFGAIDTGLTYVSNVGGKSNIYAQDGAQRANALGIQGIEDLGAGRSAVFRLVTGFSLNTGALSTANQIYKESWVGLRDSEIGQISFGKQYHFMLDMEKYYAFLETGILAEQNADIDRAGGDWVTNTVQYRSRDFGGMKFGAMYGFGSTDTLSTSLGRQYSFLASYDHGPFSVALTTVAMNGSPLTTTAVGLPSVLGVNVNKTTSINVDRKIIAAGMSYKIGAFTALGMYTHTHLSYAAESAVDQVYRIGFDFQATPALQFSAMEALDHYEDAKWFLTNLAAIYSLSKRTNTYINLAYEKADGASSYAAIRKIGASSTPTQIVVRAGIVLKF